MSTILNPLTASITFYQGDVQNQIDELAYRAEEARKQGESVARTNDEKPEWMRLAEEHDALVEEHKADAVTVIVRALGRKTWRELVNAHPPREGNKYDEAAGVNEESFAEALVPLSVSIEGVASDAERDRFLDSLNDARFSQIYLMAFGLNRGGQSSPKADLLSRLTQISTGT